MPELQNSKNKRSEIDIKKTTKGINVKIKAMDIIALKARTNSIIKLIEVHEKVKMANKEIQEKINQLQIIEQSLQTYLSQKLNFQAQLKEVETALAELENSKTAYKIVGGIMVLSEKKDFIKDLNHKKELLSLRLKNIENQESKIRKKAKDLQEEVLGKIKKEK